MCISNRIANGSEQCVDLHISCSVATHLLKIPVTANYICKSLICDMHEHSVIKTFPWNKNLIHRAYISPRSAETQARKRMFFFFFLW